MPLIAVLGQKGGAGKTTLAVNLASCLRERGHEVGLLDTDPQGSASDWAALAEMPCEPALRGRDIDERWNFTIVDGAPGLVPTTLEAAKAADVILIPVQPSSLDVWASEDLAVVIRARQQAARKAPQAAFVVSREVQGTRLAASVLDALEALELPVLEARLGQRVAYAEAVGRGTWAGELDEKARREMEAITDQTLDLL